jgi:nitroimidazol reductase NimA-like FMN-containing flavoprotein (pyridoxamine 5'-phosphate oxidase superfamily)
MSAQQGDVALLDNPVAQELLRSNYPANLAYVWRDGTPRVVPIWFHWNGKELVLNSPPGAPKLNVLRDNTKVAISIDSRTWPYKVLSVRGTARVEIVDEPVTPEYAASAERYFGEEGGKQWGEQVKGVSSQMARIKVTPEWVAILDFVSRFPSAISG